MSFCLREKPGRSATGVLVPVLVMLLALSGCVAQYPSHSGAAGRSGQREASGTLTTSPVQVPARPAQPITPPPSATIRSAVGTGQGQATHPRYAPPPGVDAHWSDSLGVYVVNGQPLYYRQRVFYRYVNGWQSSASPDGPWEHISPGRVPSGLRHL